MSMCHKLVASTLFLICGISIALSQSSYTAQVRGTIKDQSGARVNGAAVTINAEGFDGKEWRGTIEEIPDAVTSRRLKPLDASKPIDTRVLLVKIALQEATPLKLGQRVEVQIH